MSCKQASSVFPSLAVTPPAKRRRLLQMIPVFIGAQIANLARAQKHLMLQTAATPARLDRLARLVDGGVVRPTIAGSFALADARAAFTAMEKGGVTGKIVVTV